MPDLQYANRHDRPKAYQRNGAIFIVTMKYFLKSNQLWGGRIGILNMPYERSIDIDTAEDLIAAKEFLK